MLLSIKRIVYILKWIFVGFANWPWNSAIVVHDRHWGGTTGEPYQINGISFALHDCNRDYWLQLDIRDISSLHILLFFFWLCCGCFMNLIFVSFLMFPTHLRVHVSCMFSVCISGWSFEMHWIMHDMKPFIYNLTSVTIKQAKMWFISKANFPITIWPLSVSKALSFNFD